MAIWVWVLITAVIDSAFWGIVLYRERKAMEALKETHRLLTAQAMRVLSADPKVQPMLLQGLCLRMVDHDMTLSKDPGDGR